MTATATATATGSMESTAAVLARLEAAGVRLRIEAGKLTAYPREAITDELRALMREHKAVLREVVEQATAATTTTTATAPAGTPAGPASVRTPAQAATGHLSAEAVEARRKRAIALLVANPDRRLAVICDAEGDPVPVAVAIRGKGTCEVHIPAARFCPFKLLELVAQHSGSSSVH